MNIANSIAHLAILNDFNKYQKEYKDMLLSYMKDSKYQYLGHGRNRAAFRVVGKDYVHKVPMNAQGVDDNCYECYLYEKSVKNNKRNVDDVKYAKCHLVNDFVLQMEYVESYRNFTNRNELPEWVDCIDCAQVGYNSMGKLVAYDYGA